MFIRKIKKFEENNVDRIKNLAYSQKIDQFSNKIVSKKYVSYFRQPRNHIGRNNENDEHTPLLNNS